MGLIVAVVVVRKMEKDVPGAEVKEENNFFY